MPSTSIGLRTEMKKKLMEKKTCDKCVFAVAVIFRFPLSELIIAKSFPKSDLLGLMLHRMTATQEFRR